MRANELQPASVPVSPAHSLASNVMFAPPYSATAGPHHPRQRSQSWDHAAGLPPRPNDIDGRQDWQHAMIERPQPMNAISKHPKVKLDVFLNSNAFQAGAAISGTIQVTSATSNHLRLGDIAVELEAFEELTSRDHAATQTFLYNRTLFQGQHLPPSNAVLPSAPHHGYWTARKGRTTFPFSFRLPSTAPSSITFAGNAAVRYVVKATVQAWYQDSKTVVATKADAAVVEHWHDEYDAEYAQPVERIGEAKLFMGGHGSVWLEASIPHQLFTAGDRAVVRAGIRNASKRDVSGLRIDLVRCLSFPVAGTQQKGPTITQVLHTQHFKGQPFDFASGCEQVLDHLAIDLPNDTRTIRKTRLFEVTVALIVSLPMGSFAKDLQVKIPIYVAHPASVREQQHQRHLQYSYQQPAFAALPPQAAIPRSQSAMGQHGIHMPMSPSPTPSPAMMQDHFAIPRSQSAMAQHAPHSPAMASPASPSPMSPYNRPHSAAPAPAMISLPSTPLPFAASPAQQSYSHQQQITPMPLQYDASNNAWNASRFQPVAFPSMNEQQPQEPRRSYLAPGPEAQPIPPPQPQPQPEPQPQPPLGLATITEDSESRANTITLKSIRAMGGDRTGVRKSVSKTDVELFEEIVKASSADSAPGSDNGVDKAAMATGRVNARDVFGTADEPRQSTEEQDVDKANYTAARTTAAASFSNTSHPPVPSKTDIVPVAHEEIPMASASSETELHTTPAAKRQVTLPLDLSDKGKKALSTPTSPARPSSAQGMGLTALEQRLGSTSRGSSPAPVAKATLSVKPTTSKPSISSSASALRLRAAAVEERARKASLEGPAQSPPLVRQTPKSPLSVTKDLPSTSKTSESSKAPSLAGQKQPATASASKVASAPSSSAVSADAGGRKVVDPSEARKLGKDAVGRIGGWLSQSTTPPSSQQNVGSSAATSHAISASIHNTPKTPSPSAILQRNISNASSISPSAALGGGSLRSSQPVGGSTATLTRAPSGNKEISAIASTFGGIKTSNGPAPAAKSALQTTSKTLYRDIESGDESSSQDSTRVAAKAAPIAPGLTRKLTESFEREAAPVSTTNSEHDNAPRYDVRSVRGGRGGRVASAASLWASIANGTDGKLPVPSNTNNPGALPGDGSATSTMRRTMVNARPQARRSMNGEAPALDFTDRSKVEAAIREQEDEAEKEKKEQQEATSAVLRSSPLPSRATPKAMRPKKTTSASTKAAIAIPSAFSGHPSNNANRGKRADASSPDAAAAPPKITRRAAPPFLNTTTPKVHLSSSSSSSGGGSGNGIGAAATGSSDSAGEVPAMSGRGTTRAVGKERMAELRNLFAATAAK